jgi:hypothetical protein
MSLASRRLESRKALPDQSPLAHLTGRPRFSVLIPTRDRPAYVRNALESVLNQSFGDFEVIICDNFKDHPCEAEVRTFDDPRIRYMRPPAPLAMHDNWEFAIDQARGDFVTILIDKTLLRLSALERLQAATQSHPADIYSWTSDAYYLTHEAEGDAGRGFIVPVRGEGEPFYVKCSDELAERLKFHKRIGTEGPGYNYGKICFSFYSRDLISRIKARFGKVCPLISADYTSKTLALCCTDRLVDVNKSLAVHLITTVSNGMMFANSSVHARRFLGQGGVTDRDFAAFPVPHVFCSVHNICAHDLRFAGDDGADSGLNLAAVYVEVERDLELVKEWASEGEKAEMYSHLRRFFETSPASLRNRILEEKRRVHAEMHAFREKQLDDREMLAKNREEFALYRENAMLEREAAALRHEAALQERSAVLTRREQVVAHREEFFRRVYDELGWVIWGYRLARRAKHFLLRQEAHVDPVMPSPYQSPGVSAPAELPTEGPPREEARSEHVESWPTHSGFPVFNSTIAALRYAESALYTFPMPILPTVTPAPQGQEKGREASH